MTDLKWKIKDILGFEVYDNKSNKLGFIRRLDDRFKRYLGYKSQEKTFNTVVKKLVTEVNILRKKIFVTLPDDMKACTAQKSN
jgi:ribosomal 30S subunit maturation factor RimM